MIRKAIVGAVLALGAASVFAAGSSFLNAANTQFSFGGDTSSNFTFSLGSAVSVGSGSVLSGDFNIGSVSLDGNAGLFSQVADISTGTEKWAYAGGVTLASGIHNLTVTVAPGWTNGSDNFSGKLTLTAAPTSIGVGSVTAVPEPETYAMMLAGLGAMGFMARRRKTSTKSE